MIKIILYNIYESITKNYIINSLSHNLFFPHLGPYIVLKPIYLKNFKLYKKIYKKGGRQSCGIGDKTIKEI